METKLLINHPIIIHKSTDLFASLTEINQMIQTKSLNQKKANVPDGILLTVIKTAANTIDSHLVNTKDKSLAEHQFSEVVKKLLSSDLFIKRTIEIK